MQSVAVGIQPTHIEPHELEITHKIDPRIIERVWGLEARTDPSVTWEEYIYWAKIEREEERETNRVYTEERGSLTFTKVFTRRFDKGIHHSNKKKQLQAEAIAAIEAPDEKKADTTVAATDNSSFGAVTDEEWKTAARALRTASWGTIFYLITTDILGWSSTPFVFASVGYGTGVALYIIFGVAAAWSGWILWKVFLALDSSRFPMVSYGDTFFRVYGSKMRHFINITQSFQQFMTVCVLVLANGTIIAQLSKNTICYIACFIIAMAVGMVLGNIRSLQRVGWLANASVWLNIASFIIIMVACSHFGIDYQLVTSSTLIKKIEPVKTFAGIVPDDYQQQAHGFAASFNGVNQMIYSWGGALLFVAFLAEMRHPMDFWKGMTLAYAFILVVYVFFGAFVYSFFGQYSALNIGQVIQPFALQTVGNVFGLLTAFIAAVLYFNIGMKTIYLEVLQEIFHFPNINSKKGKTLWFLLGPIYWIIAFIIAAAVPNLGGISSLVSALLILNFTYTFPGLLYFGFCIKMGAMLPGEGFDPSTRVTTRHDNGLKRYWRGFKKTWALSSLSFVYFLGGLACCGMGTWAAIEGLIAVFGPNGTVATSFSCAAPV